MGKVIFGGSLELPMWLTDGFLVTFFGRWWGAVRIHVSHVQLLYTVHCTRWTHVWWWGQYTHTCVPTATVHGVPYTVNSCVVVGAIYAYMCTYSYRTRCTHVWWWGQYTHTCVPTATVHGVLYTVNSRVVVGAIYAYMCTYSYCTWCTIHGAPYTVYSHVVVGAIYAYMCTYSYCTCVMYTVYSHVVMGAIYAYMCTYSYRTRCTVHGVLTCGGGGNIRIHVYLQLPYTVNSHVVVGAIYAYMCTYSYCTWCTIHGAPYTVYSHVVVGAIYAYMCTYSYCTRVMYTVYSRVVVGAIYAYMCTYSYRTRCTVHGVLTCGGGGNIRIHVYLQLPYMVNSCVEGAFTCGSYSRVQGTFTCGSYSRVRRATKVKFFTPWYFHNCQSVNRGYPDTFLLYLGVYAYPVQGYP